MITFVNLNPPKGEVIFAIYSSKLVVNTNVQSKHLYFLSPPNLFLYKAIFCTVKYFDWGALSSAY